jgi:hypothetical protein
MYDPSVGRWLEEDPEGFGAGDANLYRYVGNSPTNRTDSSGLQDDALDDLHVDPTNMKKVEGVMGWGFTATGPGGKKVTFGFESAYMGDWKLWSPRGKDLQRVYGAAVKINITTEGYDYDVLRVIQVARDIQEKDGNYETVSPRRAMERRKRSGWDDDSALSRGWYVDKLEDQRVAYYGSDDGTRSASFIPGTKTTKATFYDSPGRQYSDEGVELYTCAIGIKDGQAFFLGCVKWGFYNDGNNTIRFLRPEASPECPVEVGDAIRRWNEIDYNTKVEVAGIRMSPTPLTWWQKVKLGSALFIAPWMRVYPSLTPPPELFP